MADDEGPEAVQAAVAYVREQRRLRGEPTMSLTEAAARAHDHLRFQGSASRAAQKTAVTDGIKDLWIFSSYDPRHSCRMLDGGGLAITGSGEVYETSSAHDHLEVAGVPLRSDDDES